jgi:colanic acid biosynthesis glycosyl transferase WcaI
VRILICGINFAPEPVGIGKYTGEMAAWLAGRGHEVRVVTAPPHNPWWRVPSEFSAWKYHRDYRFEFGGKSSLQVPSSGRVDVFRSPLWVPESPNGIKRLLHLASFGLSSLPVILWQRAWCPELVLLVEPTLFCSLQVLLVAAWSGARAWLQVQDFEVDAAFELGDLSSSLLRNCALAFERRLLRKFDRVSAISGRMVERLISKGVDSSRCVLFPNWVDTNAIYPLSSPSPLRRDLGIIDEVKIVVLYSGSMGKKQGLDLLADAARRHSHRSDLLYVFSGEGSYRRAFIEKTKGLSNVIHLPLQPVERLNDLLNLADIHVLPQRADAADLVMPSKLTGMLASGRPIVATAKSGTQLSMTVEGCGVVVAPGDLDAFTSAILSLAGSKDLRLKLGQEARKYAIAHFDLDRILFRFEQAIFAACNRPEIRPEAGQLHSTVARVGSSEPCPSMAGSESDVAAKTSKPCL